MQQGRRRRQVQGNFAVGDRVMALWPPSGTWHPASIKEFIRGKYKVQYHEDRLTRYLFEHQISNDSDNKDVDKQADDSDGLDVDEQEEASDSLDVGERADDSDSLDLDEEAEDSDSINIDEQVKASDNLNVDEQVAALNSLDVDERVEASDSLDVDERVEDADSLDVDEQVKASDSLDVDEQVKSSDSLDVDERGASDSLDVDERVEDSDSLDVDEQEEASDSSDVGERADDLDSLDVDEQEEASDSSDVGERADDLDTSDVDEGVEYLDSMAIEEQVEAADSVDVDEGAEDSDSMDIEERVENSDSLDVHEQVQASDSSDVDEIAEDSDSMDIEERVQNSAILGVDERAEDSDSLDVDERAVNSDSSYVDDSDSSDVDEQAEDSDSSYVIPVLATLPRLENIHTNTKKVHEPNTIKVLSTSNVGQRKWDKKQWCCFCEKSFAKLPRHLESMHKSERDIILLSLEKSPEKRSQMLCKIRNLGNHIHNCKVIRKGEGDLLVAYRPTDSNVSPDDYGPCPHCMGYYVLRDLWKHKCSLLPKKEENQTNTKQKLHGRRVKDSKLLKPPATGISVELNKVLVHMKVDDVFMALKSDNLILDFGMREVLKLGHDVEQYNYLKTKLRELGRLLLQLRKNVKQPNASLDSFIHPTKVRDIVTAVNDIAGYNKENYTYKVPSLALKIGHSLNKCALIMKSRALEVNNKEAAEIANNFMSVIEMNWDVNVSSHALRTLAETKRNKPLILPTNADVVKMKTYLHDVGEEEARIVRADDGNSCSNAWRNLNEIVLCQVIIFNRRRQGEVSKMKLEDFENRHHANPDDMCILSKLELNLCKILQLVEIVGKKGRTVPVLLSKEMIERLELLVEKRRTIGVAESNVFLFACSMYSSSGHIRGSDCLRKHAALAQLGNEDVFRSTKLRKHVATSSQILSLSENELNLLASFMGHDLRVHRQYYQVPDTVLRVAKLSKLFISLENGKLPTQQGKNLQNITIESENNLSSDESDSDKENVGGDEGSMDSAREHAQPRGTKRKWSEAEITAIQTIAPMLHLKLPGKETITNLQRKYPVLKDRTWKNIKDYCRNNKNKLLKQ